MAAHPGDLRIRLAESDDDLRRCFPVMAQLRPHLDEPAFLERARRQKADDGYRIAFLESGGVVRAVAGFRIMEMLVCGRHLYVDDLVTDAAARSTGLGGRLFDWLTDHARAAGCVALELDSGLHRAYAHRFYFRKGMTVSSFHFVLPLGADSPRAVQRNSGPRAT